MPKKTKEEKIIANYRKKIKLLEQYNNKTTASQKNMDVKNTLVQIETKPLNTIPNEEDLIIKTFFFKDFGKSISLILFIIALEIVLYFASIKGALPRILKFR